MHSENLTLQSIVITPLGVGGDGQELSERVRGAWQISKKIQEQSEKKLRTLLGPQSRHPEALHVKHRTEIRSTRSTNTE